LRNIVGNKGGLGGGYCTIMCNNAPFPLFRAENDFFFKHLLDPSIQNPTPIKNKIKKHLYSPVKIWPGPATALAS